MGILNMINCGQKWSFKNIYVQDLNKSQDHQSTDIADSIYLSSTKCKAMCQMFGRIQIVSLEEWEFFKTCMASCFVIQLSRQQWLDGGSRKINVVGV